jgi:UDP-N-acetylglucosamine 2-epimerase (non-hydrolysing)
LISDGGSNQEECYYLGKPVLLLRKATERTEGLGRNCVLSEYKDALIDEFIDNVHKYRFDFLDSEQSPSRVIIEHCRQFI